MTQFIILDKEDIEALNNNQPVSVFPKYDGTKIVVCTEEYYEKQIKGGKE